MHFLLPSSGVYVLVREVKTGITEFVVLLTCPYLTLSLLCRLLHNVFWVVCLILVTLRA